MKVKVLTVAGAMCLLLTANDVNAQVRQSTPTGQVPKAYSGVQSAPANTYKPKPTGQIAPEAPGQLGTIVQPAPAAAPVQKVSDVQDLGFEVNSRPTTQQGMVPKVNTSQDPRTMRERYEPNVVQQQTVTTEQVQQVIQQPQTQQVPVTGSYAPATQTTPAQSSVPATSSQPTSQPRQVNTQQPASPTTQSTAPRAVPQRVDPK